MVAHVIQLVEAIKIMQQDTVPAQVVVVKLTLQHLDVVTPHQQIIVLLVFLHQLVVHVIHLLEHIIPMDIVRVQQIVVLIQRKQDVLHLLNVQLLHQ